MTTTHLPVVQNTSSALVNTDRSDHTPPARENSTHSHKHAEILCPLVPPPGYHPLTALWREKANNMQWPLKFILSHQHLLKMLNPSASERDELWCKSGFPPRKHPHPNLLQHHPSQGPLDPPSAGPGLLFSQTLLQGLVAQSSLLHSYLHSCHEVLVLPLIRAQKTLA